MKRLKGTTYYSKTWPGAAANFDWAVRFDITDGIVGITQNHNAPLGQDEPWIERVLLTKRQVRELIKFVQP